MTRFASLPAIASNTDGEAGAIASATQVLDGAGNVRNDFLVMPFGTPIATRNGAQHNLRNREHAERVLGTTRDFLASAQMAVDYDHQTYTATNTSVGGTAKASGWVGDLEIRPDGIWATGVKWTGAGSDALASQEYRYISPYYKYDPATGDVTRIVNLGITNLPNFDMAAIAAETSTNEGHTGMKKIAVALGLAEDATEDQILQKITDWKAAKSTASAMQTGLISVFGLDPKASTEDITAAAKQAKEAVAVASEAEGQVDLTKFVPRAEFDALASTVNNREEQDGVAMVEQAIADGKIAPASKDFFIGQVKKDRGAVASFIETAPAIMKDVDFENIDKKTAKGLTAEEAAIASQLGLTEDEYLKGKTEEGAA
jgi:phage I-like protein